MQESFVPLVNSNKQKTAKEECTKQAKNQKNCGDDVCAVDWTPAQGAKRATNIALNSPQKRPN